jgi:hypothetical protein
MAQVAGARCTPAPRSAALGGGKHPVKALMGVLRGDGGGGAWGASAVTTCPARRSRQKGHKVRQRKAPTAPRPFSCRVSLPASGPSDPFVIRMLPSMSPCKGGGGGGRGAVLHGDRDHDIASPHTHPPPPPPEHTHTRKRPTNEEKAGRTAAWWGARPPGERPRAGADPRGAGMPPAGSPCMGWWCRPAAGCRCG